MDLNEVRKSEDIISSLFVAKRCDFNVSGDSLRIGMIFYTDIAVYIYKILDRREIEVNNTLPKKIDILDVTLRETDCSMKKSFVPTDAKLWIAGKLIDAGFRRFEVGTFSHIKVRAAVQRYSRGSERTAGQRGR